MTAQVSPGWVRLRPGVDVRPSGCPSRCAADAGAFLAFGGQDVAVAGVALRLAAARKSPVVREEAAPAPGERHTDRVEVHLLRVTADRHRANAERKALIRCSSGVAWGELREPRTVGAFFF